MGTSLLPGAERQRADVSSLRFARLRVEDPDVAPGSPGEVIPPVYARTPARPWCPLRQCMSVYTPVSAPDLDAWLTRYAVGGLSELLAYCIGYREHQLLCDDRARPLGPHPVRAAACWRAAVVLKLMAHLARAGVEVPAPVPDRTSALFSLLNGKPAGLVARVDGAPVETPFADALRPRGHRVGAAASCVADLSSASHQSPRSGVVAPGRTRRQAASRRHASGAPRWARSDFRPGSAAASCPKARSMAIFSATTCSSPVTEWPASSTSASRRPISSRTISRSPSTTGAPATSTALLSPKPPATAMVSAYDAARPLTCGRARSMAGAAAGRRVALLAVTFVRHASAASGRTHACARSCVFRAHPARSRGEIPWGFALPNAATP